MKQLEASVKRLNQVLGRPEQAWSDGKANIGNYHVYGDQCGYALHCIMNEGGGVHSFFYGSTMRELDGKIQAMIQGASERS
jgi:hypothetical protein